MTMLATSRVKRSRLPLADRSMFSAMFAPLKSIASVPPSPSIDVAAVAGIPLERVVARAELREVVAAVAVDEVVAVAADDGVDALRAGDRVVAGAAVDPERGRLRLLRRAGDHVVAAEPVDEQLVGRGRRDGDESPAGR